MKQSIDYFFAPQSPWTYLGHARFAALAAHADCAVRVLPVDFAKVFAVSGGLPLRQRAAQRQAYRLVDLRRSADHAQLPLNLHPRHFPVQGDDAARLIIAVDMADGPDAAMRLTAGVLSAVWADERDIADRAVLGELLARNQLDATRLVQSCEASVQQRYASDTQAAIDAGVFGAPSYCVGGEIFWGQDRLDFLQRKLLGS